MKRHWRYSQVVVFEIIQLLTLSYDFYIVFVSTVRVFCIKDVAIIRSGLKDR